MLKSLLFLFLFSLEPVLVHYLIFIKNGFVVSSAYFVWVQAIFFFAFIFTFQRRVVIPLIILESLLFLLLLSYHHYFSEPLMLHTVFDQYYEGLIFAGKSFFSFFNKTTGVLLVSMLLKLAYIYKGYQPFSRPKLIRICVSLPFIGIVLMSYGFFCNTNFEKKDFNLIAAYLGYNQAWAYELITDMDHKNLIAAIIQSSVAKPQPQPQELSDMVLADNIFVIQLESIDYAAFKGVVSGRSLMPYLNEMAQHGFLYEVAPHDKEASSNADFSVLTGTEIYSRLYSTVYGLLPPENYAKMFTLPKVLAEKGYKNRFYHGFSGSFFNRREHIQAMGFDKIWFSDNLPIHALKGEWGFDDLDLFKFVVKDNTQNPAKKNFNFIISVSSHEDFEVGRHHREIVKTPSNLSDSYYNAAHYVDTVIRQLVNSAPENSLFVIYSDHLSNMSEDHRTFLLIYQKGSCAKAYQREISVNQVSAIIKSLLGQP